MFQSQGNLEIYHSTFSLNKRALNAVGVDSMDRPQAIKTVAWIIIIGDSLHNFIDGWANYNNKLFSYAGNECVKLFLI